MSKIKIIINQDRNIIFMLHEEQLCCLRIKNVIFKDITIGFNIMYNNNILGTFDTNIEALKEINNIYNNNVYRIND